MKNLFDVNNIFFKFMGRLSDLLILNFTWIIFSLPIITIGASTTALYSVSLKLINGSEEYVLKDFVRSFKEKFKKSTLAWLGILLISVILISNLLFWPRFKSLLSFVIMIPVLFLSFVLLMTVPYIFSMISTSADSLMNTCKLSFFLSIKNLPHSFIIVIMNLLFLGIPILFPLALFLPIFIGFALNIYLNSHFINLAILKEENIL